MDMFTFIKDHFMHAAPILLSAALGLIIILERTYCLYMRYPMGGAESFFEKISSAVMKANVAQATQLCAKYKHKPLAKVVKAGMTRAHLPEGLIQDGIQLSLQKCTQLITKRTAFLATIANVATLLGLVGTIAGLIQSFEAVAHADAQQKSALLSAGISTSMNATMLGLGVAVPCMVAYSILINRSNNLIADLEQTAVRTLDILKQRFYSSELTSSSSENMITEQAS